MDVPALAEIQQTHRLLKLGYHTLSNALQEHRICQPHENQHKFIAANPRHTVFGPGLTVEHLRDHTQDIIPRRMAEGIIDSFEII